MLWDIMIDLNILIGMGMKFLTVGYSAFEDSNCQSLNQKLERICLHATSEGSLTWER
jgi:hypothetical protein